MPQNEPYAHVYRRIAEHVSRDLSVDLSPEDVDAIINNKVRIWNTALSMNAIEEAQKIHEAVLAEAREYGLRV